LIRCVFCEATKQRRRKGKKKNLDENIHECEREINQLEGDGALIELLSSSWS